MKRAAFLRRMAFAALACGFLDFKLPEIEAEPAAGDMLPIQTGDRVVLRSYDELLVIDADGNPKVRVPGGA